MVDGDARLFHFRSSRNVEDATVSKEAESAVFFITMARVRPRRFRRVDHLSSSETKLCSDARFMTASRAKSSSVSSSFFETCETRMHAMTI